MTARRLAALDRLIAALRDIWAAESDLEARMRSLQPGMIDFVAPHEIHAERGGAGRSVAIIIRSERLVGRTPQLGFDPAAGTVHEMFGPTQVPFELVEAR
jgi:hypothetical protein